MAAPAFPYFYDMEYTQTERQRRKMDAVWRRLLLRENPFEGYQGKKNYSLLVCGHTITDFYYQQMNREAGGNILSSLPGNRNRREQPCDAFGGTRTAGSVLSGDR